MWQGTVVGEVVGDYREENYKTNFEIAHKNSKLQRERKNIGFSQPTLDLNSVRVKAFRPPLDSTPAGAKTPNTKTPEKESSASKERSQK